MLGSKENIYLWRYPSFDSVGLKTHWLLNYSHFYYFYFSEIFTSKISSKFSKSSFVILLMLLIALVEPVPV
jgi:hypothetical protein